MVEKINQIEKETLDELSKVKSLDALEEIRVKVMGKKGSMTEILKSMKDLSVEEKKRELQRAACITAVSIPNGSIKSKAQSGSSIQGSQFQFQMVQLKACNVSYDKLIRRRFNSKWFN